jgi:DNA replication and repair protein RecF
VGQKYNFHESFFGLPIFSRVENDPDSLYLKELKLWHYKNYEVLDISFLPGVNCLVGLNGSGKTNLLDAIYYLCYTKSYFHYGDLHVIAYDAPFLRIEGVWQRQDEAMEVSLKLPRGLKKTITVNGDVLARNNDHIGAFPAVIIAPDDNEIILGGSEERRRFLDATLSLTAPAYLGKLLHYQKLLQQRNALLKEFAGYRRFDGLLLDAFDAQLAPLGDYLWKMRADFLRDWLPVFTSQFQYFVDEEEQPVIGYQLPGESMVQLLAANRQVDLQSQRTTIGPHTDDLEFKIKGHSLKKAGSQGQQKSFLVALKLAQWKTLHELKDIKPVLLLDDLFDKLDNLRISKLLQLMKNGYLGQVFITDTDAARMEQLFLENGIPAQMTHINKGQIEKQYLAE